MMRMLLVLALVALFGLSAHAQLPDPTPKILTATGASIVTSWAVVGYDVRLTVVDADHPPTIVIRYQRSVRTNGGAMMDDPVQSVTIRGATAVAAVIADLEMRTASLTAAKDPSPYYNATKAALYAYLQAHGAIDVAAQ